MAQNNLTKATQKFLCQIADLEDPSSKSFEIKIGRKKTDIFVVRKGEQVFAYQNICPHAQAPLEWNPDEYLDEKKEHIICALHGAIFMIEDGNCIEGPCGGAALTSVDLELLDGDAFYK